MDFSLDPASRSPLFRQLQDQIRYAISVGELRAGDALPSIRELEFRLGINRNTVRRAYLELQLEGTLQMRAGREAVVAPRASIARQHDHEARSATGEALAAELLQRAEAAGLDSVAFADAVMRTARERDASYPRCAFLECSDRQASSLADQAEGRLGRRVVPIHLHALRRGEGTLPPSVRFIITPHWHAAEAEEVANEHQSVIAVSVQMTAGCSDRLRALGEHEIGLVVRDPQSLPGFRERLRQHVGKAGIDAALAGDEDAVKRMLNRVDHVVFTSPCAETVRALAPHCVGTHELIFETTPADLDAAARKMFPPLTRQAHAHSG